MRTCVVVDGVLWAVEVSSFAWHLYPAPIMPNWSLKALSTLDQRYRTFCSWSLRAGCTLAEADLSGHWPCPDASELLVPLGGLSGDSLLTGSLEIVFASLCQMLVLLLKMNFQ